MNTTLKSENVKTDETNIYKKLNDLNKLKKKNNEKALVKRRNNNIIFIFLVLLGIGFFNFYSTISHYNSIEINRKILKFLMILISSLMVAFMAFYSYELLKKRKIRALLLFSGILIFLIVAFSPNSNLFPTINGGKGWVRVGKFSLQVTEIFKIVYTILLAGVLSRGKDDDENYTLIKNLFLIVFYFLIFFILLLSLKDLGTGVHYFLITIFFIFISDIKSFWILIISVFTSLFSSIVLPLYYFSSSGYKHHRIKVYLEGLLNNSYDRFDAFQIYQSLVGIGTGGLLGKGYGNGIQKYNYIPEIETDFAIATYAEEMGFIGIILLLVTFLIFFILIMNIAEKSKSHFGKYLVAGIGGYFITQVIMNICVAVGLLPVLGIPLPFISSGGSSLLTLTVAIALVLRVNSEILKD